MEQSPEYKPQVSYPKAAVPKYQGPKYQSDDDHESKFYAYQSVQFTKETVRPYVGTWVRCQSMYGMHEGLLHRALRDGIVLVNHTQLMKGEALASNDVDFGVFQSGTDLDVQQVQFFLPFPGMFVPYGGMFGLYPRPFIW